jgi:glycosyltransferase involved in cell wall biosynthesis
MGPGKSPRVSVLLAARNEDAWIGGAIDSILRQTFGDLELLVTNDGSIDGTGRIIRRAAERDARVKVLENEAPRGLAYCLNRCAEMARGEYLARMDADDVSLPDRIDRQVRFLDSHPEVEILGTAAYKVDRNGIIVGDVNVEPGHDRMVAEVYKRNPFIHPSVMFRKSAFRRLGGYDESLLRGQDYDLWFRAAQASRLANITEPLLLYREGPAVHWKGLLYSVRIKCLSIRREGRPLWYYWYPLRSLLSVPWTYARQAFRGPHAPSIPEGNP